MTTQIDPRIDHYKILGVSEDASADEIKKAYRRLAKRYHPDRTGGDKAKETRFKEIGQAYDVVGDPEKRRQYDAMRSGASFGGFPGFSDAAGRGAGDINDIFAQMFSGGGARSGPGGVHFRFQRGTDPFGPDIPFGGRPARRRGQSEAAVERRVRASDGSTLTQRSNDVYSDVRLTLDQAILGTIVEVPTLESRSKVKIPPGTSSGVKLRLKGKGPMSANGARGNHYVTVQIDVPKKLDEKAKELLIQFMQQTKRT